MKVIGFLIAQLLQVKKKTKKKLSSADPNECIVFFVAAVGVELKEYGMLTV